MSYARSGDEDDDVRLDWLRERLEHEVSVRTGVDFPVLADRDGAAWAEHWQRRLVDGLDADTMLLVIVTPDLFASEACRQEIARFREREKALGRADLIVAVHYASTSPTGKRMPFRGNELAWFMRSRRHADWRALRTEAVASPVAREAVSRLADRMSAVVAADPVAAQTHVVDASGRDGLRSVSEAIKAARPGSRILVRPGIYEEPLVLDKPLEVIGDGPAEAIVIRVRDNHVAEVRTGSARLANLTLCQDGGDKTWWHAVSVGQGVLDIDDCDISCPANTCVRIGEGAAAHVRGSTIHHAKRLGMAVCVNAGHATVEDCEIFASGSIGISASDGGSVALRRNRIHDCEWNAVSIHGGATGTVEGNEIFAIGWSGVTISDGAKVAVRRNRIHDCGHCGITAAGASGTAEDNDIAGSGMWGVLVRAEGDCTLRRNRISGSRYEAVAVRDGAHATAEDNDLTGNGRGAWSIATDRERCVARARNQE